MTWPRRSLVFQASQSSSASHKVYPLWQDGEPGFWERRVLIRHQALSQAFFFQLLIQFPQQLYDQASPLEATYFHIKRNLVGTATVVWSKKTGKHRVFSWGAQVFLGLHVRREGKMAAHHINCSGYSCFYQGTDCTWRSHTCEKVTYQRKKSWTKAKNFTEQWCTTAIFIAYKWLFKV